MSGFSTHPIVPSLFKDMKNPSEFCKMLNWAYAAATVIYLCMGVCGYLMFGNGVSDEVTRNLANTGGYPKVLNKVAIWLIIINPLSKFALAARPINSTLELILGVEHSQMNRPTITPRQSQSAKVKYPPVEAMTDSLATEGEALQREADDALATPRPNNASSSTFTIQAEAADGDRDQQLPQQSPLANSAISLRAAERTANWSKTSKIMVRIAVQVSITLLVGLTAIVLPGFEKVMAFLGAFLACATCIFGPLLANMSLLHHEMTRFNIVMDVLILTIFAVVAAVGTVWSFLPLS